MIKRVIGGKSFLTTWAGEPAPVKQSRKEVIAYHQPVTNGNGLPDYKEVTLARVNAEVRDLVEEIRKYGFTVQLDNESYKIYKDGKIVTTEEGQPITLHTTPSDHRWYKNTVASLVRNKVLPGDPKKEGQMKKAKEERPPEVDRYMRTVASLLEQKRKERARSEPIVKAARALYQDVGGGINEFVRIMIQVSAEAGITPPSQRGVSDHIYKLMAGKTAILTPTYERMWRATLKHFDIELEGEVNTPPTVEPEKTPELDPERPLQRTECRICGFVAKDLRGLRAHERSHTKKKCRWCGEEQIGAGIGAHERWCEKNPNNARTLKVSHVPEAVREVVSSGQTLDEAIEVEAEAHEKEEVGVQVVEGDLTEREATELINFHGWTEATELINFHDWTDQMQKELELGRLVKSVYKAHQSRFLMELLGIEELSKESIVKLISLLS